MPDNLPAQATPDPGPPIRLGTTTCLLREPVRSDDGHKLDRCPVHVLDRSGEWVPVCPEACVALLSPIGCMGRLVSLFFPRS
jgi:hypothetical protein